MGDVATKTAVVLGLRSGCPGEEGRCTSGNLCVAWIWLWFVCSASGYVGSVTETSFCGEKGRGSGCDWYCWFIAGLNIKLFRRASELEQGVTSHGRLGIYRAEFLVLVFY